MWYTWVGNQDVLANSADTDANKFDFESMRPSINKMKNKLCAMDARHVSNMLRCDLLSKENTNTYPKVAKENKETKGIVWKYISAYLSGVTNESSVKIKSNLFTAPDNNS